MPTKEPKKTKTPAKKAPAAKTAAKAPAKKKAVAKTPAAPKAVKAKKAPVAKTEANLEQVLKNEPVAKSAPAVKPVAEKGKPYFYAAGKRKTAVASVRLYEKGNGKVTVNNRTFEQYFPVFTDRDKVLSPFSITSTLKMFDVSSMVHGGGVHSQAEAVRHAIARALLIFNPELRTTLKHAGYLTRDSRVKERKKYGLHRARRAPQWAKR